MSEVDRCEISFWRVALATIMPRPGSGLVVRRRLPFDTIGKANR